MPRAEGKGLCAIARAALGLHMKGRQLQIDREADLYWRRNRRFLFSGALENGAGRGIRAGRALD